MDTQTSVTTQSALPTAAATSAVTVILAPLARAQATTAGGGASGSGQASRSSNWNCTAAWIQDVAMLLPSPHQAIVRPAIGPQCSSKVITSAISWQGWVRLVRPLMTGTLAASAISSSFASLV